MTFPSLHRQPQPRRQRATVALLPSDNTLRRAENIVTLLQLWGDQADQERWIATVKDTLDQYAAVDKEGRDDR